MSRRRKRKPQYDRYKAAELGVSTYHRKEGHGVFIQHPAGRSGPVTIIRGGNTSQ